MKITVHNFTGKKIKDIDVSDSVFGVKMNNSLVHQVYVAMASNKRVAIAHTKDRSEVAGSNRKPWKQKGTGRARTGSVKNPIWRKGGTIFGPTKDRNFKKRINKKVRQQAIKMVLSEKLKSDNLIIVDNFDLKAKKTKVMAKSLKDLKITGKNLISLEKKEKDLYLYIRNIVDIKCELTENLNVYDMLNNKKLVLSENSVKYLEKKYSTK